MSSFKGSEPTSSITNAERSLTIKLHSAFATTCEKFVSSIKYSRMKKIFREVYEENPETLKNLHDQLCVQLKKGISEDLDELCKMHTIDFLLNSLEEIKKNQESSACSWRPSGNPEEDLRDHIYPVKLKHKEDLQAILAKLKLSNEEQVNIAEVNHAEILHIKKSNNDLHEKFSNISSSLTGTKLQNLQATYSNMMKKA